MMTKYLPFASSLVGFCSFRRHHFLQSGGSLVVSRQRMCSSSGSGNKLFAIDHVITF